MHQTEPEPPSEELRQAREELLHAKEYAENLIQSANAIVVGVDRDGNVTVVITCKPCGSATPRSVANSGCLREPR